MSCARGWLCTMVWTQVLPLPPNLHTSTYPPTPLRCTPSLLAQCSMPTSSLCLSPRSFFTPLRVFRAASDGYGKNNKNRRSPPTAAVYSEHRGVDVAVIWSFADGHTAAACSGGGGEGCGHLDT